MKIKSFAALLAALFAMLCSASALAVEFTDANDRMVTVDNPQSVVALYASYGDAWLNAGGTLSGAISDTLEDERADEDIVNLGGVHSPNMELLFTLNPDFVLLSADVSQHAEIGTLLEQTGIPHVFLSTHDWRDYMEMMRIFTEITGREDLYQEQVETVQQPIEALIAATDDHQSTALLLRANSSSVKAKNSESTVAGTVLQDMSFVNIADGESPLSESLSMEAILLADPDYIFVVYQGGDAEAAERSFRESLGANPAWNTLTAVRKDRVIVLDPALFHYHPNSRWAEAYAAIAQILNE